MPNGISPLQNELQQGLPAIRASGWGQNYYVDAMGNKINKDPNMNYYFDSQGNVQQFGKPQVDWSKVSFGQNPYETPGALLGDETIVNNPYSQPTQPPQPIQQPQAVQQPQPVQQPSNLPLVNALQQPTSPATQQFMQAPTSVPLTSQGVIGIPTDRPARPIARRPIARSPQGGISAGGYLPMGAYTPRRSPLEERLRRLRGGM